MTYKNAKGAIPWKPGDELPESIIECGRGHCEEMEKEVDVLRSDLARVTAEKEKLKGFIDCWQQDEEVWKEQEAELIAERDRLLETLAALECGPLNHLNNWAGAYPDDVFVEPTKEQWAAVNELLKEHGYSMTALNGSVARHCVQGIQKYVREAIKLIEDAAKENEG
jgi:hypothetical protein